MTVIFRRHSSTTKTNDSHCGRVKRHGLASGPWEIHLVSYPTSCRVVVCLFAVRFQIAEIADFYGRAVLGRNNPFGDRDHSGASSPFSHKTLERNPCRKGHAGLRVRGPRGLRCLTILEDRSLFLDTQDLLYYPTPSTGSHLFHFAFLPLQR